MFAQSREDIGQAGRPARKGKLNKQRLSLCA
nr:MAG TPA: hypothetical protein [Caudoviricetes sp.]